MRIYLSSIILTLLTSSTAQEDYCNPSLCENVGRKAHVACNNDGKFGYDCPKNAKLVDITPIIPLILNEHNNGRNELAGGNLEGYESAERMATMQWDEELAQMATFNVKKCMFKQDECRNLKRYTYSGQNVQLMGYDGNESEFRDEEIIQNGIIKWVAEFIEGSMNAMRKFPINVNEFKQFGHFALIAVESNNHVGCAAARYKRDGFNYFLLTCNYATVVMGNYPTYKEGLPAKGCKSGKNFNFENLCSIKEIY